MFDGVIDRRSTGQVTPRFCLRDDAPCQRELGITQREPGCVNLEAGRYVTVVPLEVREWLRLADVDQRQIVAFGNTDDLGVVALRGVAADEDLECCGSRNHVVVCHGKPVGTDDETAAGTRPVGEPGLRVAEGSLCDHLDDRRLDVTETGDPAADGRLGDRSGRGLRGLTGFLTSSPVRRLRHTLRSPWPWTPESQRPESASPFGHTPSRPEIDACIHPGRRRRECSIGRSDNSF